MLSFLAASSGAPIKPDAAVLHTGLPDVAPKELSKLNREGMLGPQSLFWTTAHGKQLLEKMGEIPPPNHFFWSTAAGKAALDKFAEAPDLKQAYAANKGTLSSRTSTKLYSTGLPNTAYGDLKEARAEGGLAKDSAFWSTPNGERLLQKIGEIPEKNDDFWSTEEGRQALEEAQQVPELVADLKENKKHVLRARATTKLVQLHSGREIATDVEAQEVQKLGRTGYLGSQSLFWTTKDGKKLLNKLGEVPAPGDFFWSTAEGKETLEKAAEAPELKAALAAHKGMSFVQLNSGREIVPDTVAFELRKLQAQGALDLQSLFWTTKDGKKLLTKMAELPAKGDYFWSTAEGRQTLDKAGEAPELKDALYAHKAGSFVQLNSGRELTPDTVAQEVQKLGRQGYLGSQSLFWTTKDGKKLLTKLGEVPAKDDFFWSTAEGKETLEKAGEAPELKAALAAHKGMSFVQLNSGRELVPDVVAQEVAKLKAQGYLGEQSLFWTTKDGKKLLNKLGEVPAKGDYFWSTAEGKETLEKAAEAPELKDALYAHKAASFVQLNSGRELVPDTVAFELRKLKAQGIFDMQSLFWTTKDGKKLLTKMAEVPAKDSFYWSTEEGRQALAKAGEAPELQEALVKHKKV